MPAEPAVKRTVAFFDGQNLFYAAKYAFGYKWPNYDPLKLAQAVCQTQGWQLLETRFYTGRAESLDQAGLCLSDQPDLLKHSRHRQNRLGADRPQDLRCLPRPARLSPEGRHAVTDELRPYPDYRDSGLPWLGTVPTHGDVRRNGRLFVGRKGSILLLTKNQNAEDADYRRGFNLR